MPEGEEREKGTEPVQTKSRRELPKPMGRWIFESKKLAEHLVSQSKKAFSKAYVKTVKN